MTCISSIITTGIHLKNNFNYTITVIMSHLVLQKHLNFDANVYVIVDFLAVKTFYQLNHISNHFKQGGTI